MKTFAILSPVALVITSVVFAVKSPLNAQTEAKKAIAAKTAGSDQATPKSSQKSSAKTSDAEREEKAKAAKFANSILNSARTTHSTLKSFRSNIKQRIIIGDRFMTASGVYQQGEGNKIRLNLTVTLDSGVRVMKSSLLQVCDGEILKTLRTFGKQQRLTRRNVKQILQAAGQRGRSVRNTLITEIGLGGIPGMLASMQRVMTFDSYRKMKSEDEDIRIIEGTWNAQYQAHWKGMTQGRDAFPEYVPDRVRVYVDSGYILRRIEYLKKTREDKPLETMLSMEFDKIKLNTVLDEKDFTFVSPPKVHPEDVTKVYIDQLIQQQRAPAQKQ